MTEYPTDRSADRDPTPWDARWSLPRSDAYSPSRTPLLRGVLALAAAIGLIALADLFMSGPALGLVAALLVLAALGFLRF
jgi:hypothetical protein